MRVAFSVYGALYVVIEIVGYQLEQVSWPEITALDVATAVTNAFLTVAVLVAVLVTAVATSSAVISGQLTRSSW